MYKAKTVLKTIVKRAIPASLLDAYRERARRADLEELIREWDSCCSKCVCHTSSGNLAKVLIIPSDPRTLIGALGDDAMISTSSQIVRTLNKNAQFFVLTAKSQASEQAIRRGFTPFQIYDRSDFLARFFDILNQQRFDAVLALGADILDGYYDSFAVTRTLAACDLSARAGISTTVLGFSFNESPAAELRGVYERLSRSIIFNARDRLSFERFQLFSGHAPTLVADSAFLLAPESPPNGIVDWVNGQHRLGRKVVGINLHPMLFDYAPDRSSLEFVRTFSEILIRQSRAFPVSWLLLPHDYRRAVGDAVCLEPLAAELLAAIPDRSTYLSGIHSAATLKAVAGILDAVVTGRMHLAVASLGMGIPTLSLTYQEKFEGLYKHFNLPDWLLLDSRALLAGRSLEKALVRFITDIPTLRARVEEILPDVLGLARLNFYEIARLSA